MKCELKQAKEYQKGFKSGLVFTGFEDGEIQWMGTSEQFKGAIKLFRLSDLYLEEEFLIEVGEENREDLMSKKGLVYRDYKKWVSEGEDDGEMTRDPFYAPHEADFDLIADKLRGEYQESMRDDLSYLGLI